MLVSDFDFILPEELIAQTPLSDRAASRMLVVNGMKLTDSGVKNFADFLEPGDVVVFNNSKVIPCRFIAGEYEFTLHTKEENNWWAFAKKFNKLNIGDELELSDGTKIIVRDKNDESGVLLEFDTDDIFGVLDKVGKVPLPPYIKREATDADKDRYQTVYAKELGSMAAPTAGLHFTPAILAEIEKRGAIIVHVTLHIGAGTWAPIKVTDTKDHKMHAEFGVVTPEQADIINNAKRVIAIGTTPMRLLESAALIAKNGNRVAAFSDTTDIFITPGYKFKAVDILFTNFHLPKSTLVMLVSAFAGIEEIRAAYKHAIKEKYRFFSYGDSTILFRNNNAVEI